MTGQVLSISNIASKLLPSEFLQNPVGARWVNWGMSEGDQFLIEIELSEICSGPRIERLDGKVRVSTCSSCGIEKLLKEYGHILNPIETDQLIKLWRDDDASRVFKEVQGKLIITLKEKL